MPVKYAVFLIVVSSLAQSVIQAAGRESAGLEFYGQVESYAEYEPWNWRLNATLQFFFQTKSRKSSMIFYQDNNGKSQFMDLFLISPGKARFRAKVQGMKEIEKRYIQHDFADSKWHKVKIELSEEEIKLSIDTEDTVYNAKPIALTQYAESLDNTSLYVGGIPLKNQGWSYPAIFFDVYKKVPVVFEGCIGNVRFNRAPNGRLERARLRSSKKATHTCKGDCEKRPERCANGGRCIDMIRDSECDCRETEYEGRSCAKHSTVVFMNGYDAYMSYTLDSDNPLRSTERNALEFRFLTEAKDGVFFYMGADKDHLLVELVNGSLRVQADFGGGPVVVQSEGNVLSDSCWHHVEIRRRKRRLTAMIDLGKSGTYNANSSKFITLNFNNQSNFIYFGGGPSRELRFAKAKTLSFKGFLQKFRFEGVSVLENALQNRDGFSQTEVINISPYNVLYGQAKDKCEVWASGCSPSEDDSDNCNPPTPPPTTSIQTTTASPTTTPSPVPPKLPETQPPPPVTAKRQKPTPRPKGVSAWVIIVIVLAAMAVVFISVFLLYRWNHRYTGSFKPSKNGEGQTREPGVKPAEQQNARVYNQPAFLLYKPPKKPPTVESPVSI